ncbi:MAG: copper-binding protein [Balneolaceae bacterium]
MVTILLAIGIGFTACGGEHDHTSQSASADAEAIEPQYFEGYGTVVSVPPSKRNVIIDHGDIPGFMGAMSMAFSVRDTSVLLNIQAQDSVFFTIESTGNSAVISEIETIE